MNLFLASSFWNILLNADVLTVIALVIFAIYGAIRGFFKQIIGFIGTVLALVLASMLSKKLLGVVITNTNWVQNMSVSIGGFVEKAFPSLGDVTMDKLADILANLKLPNAFKETAAEAAKALNTETVNLSNVIAYTIAQYVMLIICFSSIFLIVKIIMLFIKLIFNIISQNSLIYGLDRVLGCVLGVLKCALILYGIVFLINVLPVSALDKARAYVEGSVVLTFISKFNLFNAILSLLQI